MCLGLICVSGGGAGSSGKNSALSAGQALQRAPQRAESTPEWGQCTAEVRMLAKDCSRCGSRWENTGDLGRARVQEAMGWRDKQRDQGNNEGRNQKDSGPRGGCFKTGEPNVFQC